MRRQSDDIVISPVQADISPSAPKLTLNSPLVQRRLQLRATVLRPVILIAVIMFVWSQRVALQI